MNSVTYSENGSPISSIFDEGYFADGHGLEESRYVFLEGNQLSMRFQNLKAHALFRIGELGFGTGLNFLAAWQLFIEKAPETARLEFTSCEKYLMSQEDFAKALSAFPELKKNSDKLAKKWPKFARGFQRLGFDNGRITLNLILENAEELSRLSTPFDSWFLDGFSPAKNPDMWSPELMETIAALSHQGTTCSTFTAAGLARRNLEAAGFTVERIKGFRHKKHMTIGKFSGTDQTAKNTKKPWFSQQKSSLYMGDSRKNGPKIAIIGAGIAGCSLAYALSKYDCEVTLYEKNEQIASEASGNVLGMMKPVLAKKGNILSNFSASAFAYTRNLIDEIGLEYFQGIHEIITDEKKRQKAENSAAYFGPNFCNIDNFFGKDSLFVKEATALSPVDFCEKLLSKAGDLCKKGLKLTTLHRESRWIIEFDNGTQAEANIVILANANGINKFEQTSFLQLSPSRGQLLLIPETDLSESIPHGLSFGEYLLPAVNGQHVLGATYANNDNPEILEDDTQKLLNSLQQNIPSFSVKTAQISARVANRCVTADYLPMVGPVPDYGFYVKNYADLKHGRPNQQFPDAQYHDGLFVLGGLGSRGLSFAPFCAEILAAQIFGQSPALPTDFMHAIHPGRFLVRQLIKGR